MGPPPPLSAEECEKCMKIGWAGGVGNGMCTEYSWPRSQA